MGNPAEENDRPPDLTLCRHPGTPAVKDYRRAIIAARLKRRFDSQLGQSGQEELSGVIQVVVEAGPFFRQRHQHRFRKVLSQGGTGLQHGPGGTEVRRSRAW